MSPWARQRRRTPRAQRAVGSSPGAELHQSTSSAPEASRIFNRADPSGRSRHSVSPTWGCQVVAGSKHARTTASWQRIPPNTRRSHIRRSSSVEPPVGPGHSPGPATNTTVCEPISPRWTPSMMSRVAGARGGRSVRCHYRRRDGRTPSVRFGHGFRLPALTGTSVPRCPEYRRRPGMTVSVVTFSPLSVRTLRSTSPSPVRARDAHVPAVVVHDRP